jgi:FkbH-like protein
MTSAIQPFESARLDRITQLINKTNQFNLTTKRYNQSEIEKITQNPDYITLSATLDDKFGSNGIVSALIGEIEGEALHLGLWVMSCRVFQRDLELAVFDCLVELCQSKGLKKIIGYYFKTEKNGYVASLYESLGFNRLTDEEWEFCLTSAYQGKNKHIKIERGTG